MNGLSTKLGSGDDKPAEAPKSRLLTSTPIALSILATVFGGLSSSELTRSLTFRSLAAQQQSKAAGQWDYFQAKRIRGTTLEMTIELLDSQNEPELFTLERARDYATRMNDSGRGAALVDLLAREKSALTHLADGSLPRSDVQPIPQTVEAASKALAQRQPAVLANSLVSGVNDAEVAEAVAAAEQDADRFDKVGEPIVDAVRKLRALLRDLRGGRNNETGPPATARTALRELEASFRVAAIDFDARRYRHEASLNRRVAELYELQVRRSEVSADRHRERSRNFFYSMLIAQLGVVVSTLALARTERSGLWFLAACAGLVALLFSAYVYLSM